LAALIEKKEIQKLEEASMIFGTEVSTMTLNRFYNFKLSSGWVDMELSSYDRELIRLIDYQAAQLIINQSPDPIILSSLMDFIPETQCIMNSTCEKQLDLYCKEYPSFNYFLQLICTHID
jgi:hypothetical protein